jgi:outer membrane protein assembly factor BamB
VAPLKYGQIKNHDVIFVATQNDGVLALNSYTGNKIWQSKINDLLLSEPVLVDTDGDNINDAVVQATFSGNVVALDTTNGNQIWDLTLPNKLQAEPVVLHKATNDRGELLFVDTEGEAHTVSIENGDVINSTTIKKADRFVVSPVLRNGTNKDSAALIFTSQNGNVFSYEIGKGDE